MPMIKHFITVLLLFLPLTLEAQALSRETAEWFVRALAAESDSLEKNILPEELAVSERLGTSYPAVRHKFLIGFELDPQVRTGILDGSLIYETRIEKLEGDFSLLKIAVPETGYERSYYFKKDLLVSPVYYHTRAWPRRESRHLSFIVSDTARFNSYCEKKLEDFLDSTLDMLKYSEEERRRLRAGRLFYVLCSGQEEIERLTGFRSRGMGVLAYDYVVTTYNCHYHELVHLLVNFKLGKLPLYTHPLLQEGIAVALGGRGGKEPEVILDLGRFLGKSGILDYRELLDQNFFAFQDPSMSYPVSGIYNLFLLEELGPERYLALYRNCSGTAGEVSGMVIDDNDLPAPERWQAFLDSYIQYDKIRLGEVPLQKKLIFQGQAGSIYRAGDSYFFHVKEAVLIGPQNAPRGYRSARFDQLLPKGTYHGEKYLVTANSSEVGVYNLWTNNLTANFVCGFSLEVESVPEQDGFFEFYVRESAFDEPLEELKVEFLRKD
jgi:hypothetical protein